MSWEKFGTELLLAIIGKNLEEPTKTLVLSVWLLFAAGKKNQTKMRKIQFHQLISASPTLTT